NGFEAASGTTGIVTVLPGCYRKMPKAVEPHAAGSTAFTVWSQRDSNPQPPACKRLLALEIQPFSGSALSVGVRAYPCWGTQFGTQIGTGTLRACGPTCSRLGVPVPPSSVGAGRVSDVGSAGSATGPARQVWCGGAGWRRDLLRCRRVRCQGPGEANGW